MRLNCTFSLVSKFNFFFSSVAIFCDCTVKFRLNLIAHPSNKCDMCDVSQNLPNSLSCEFDSLISDNADRDLGISLGPYLMGWGLLNNCLGI